MSDVWISCVFSKNAESFVERGFFFGWHQLAAVECAIWMDDVSLSRGDKEAVVNRRQVRKKKRINGRSSRRKNVNTGE